MKIRFPADLLRLFAAAVGLLAALGLPLLRAEKVEFPKDEPAFNVTFPEGWTTEIDKRGTLTAKPKETTDFVLTIVSMEDIDNDKMARAAVPELVQAMAKKSELTDVKVEAIKEDKTPKGIPCLHADARGKNKAGGEIALTAIIFAADEGDYYALVTVATPEAGKSHEPELAGILESIDNK